MRTTCIEYMLDPLAAFPGPETVALAHANLVAAYVTLVVALVPYPAIDGPTWRLQSLQLPSGSRMSKLARYETDTPDTRRSRESHSSESRAS